jgi:putative glutamine amidotransferase
MYPSPVRGPIVGVTLDLQKPGEYSKFPWYALRQHYATAITTCGGHTIVLPYDISAIPAFIDLMDGLVLTGGDFDIDPQYYGEEDVHPKTSPNLERTHFELALVRAALERDMPILGICGGQQLIHVALGGALVQHIPDTYTTDIAHEQPTPRDQVSHVVDAVPGTKLHAIIQSPQWHVNSAHHQSVQEPPFGSAIVVNARAPDGVIEGIESSRHRFCVGVQWHPEFLITVEDRKLFDAFLGACAAYRLQPSQSGTTNMTNL